jgi:6-phosphogluconate dehydrogenase
MPGGNKEAYESTPYLWIHSSKVDGEPCVEYLGNGSAGNYVKMAHNGIEYGIMQLISEVYDLMKRGYNLDDNTIQKYLKTGMTPNFNPTWLK